MLSKVAKSFFIFIAVFSFYGCAHNGAGGSSSPISSQATPAISGYDAVSYFTAGKAVRGSGMHTAQYKGATYMFSSEGNKKLFESNPAKYSPEFDGYCAFGAAMGKKFYSDPNVFAVVDDKLYLNLNKDIQSKWNKERSSMITKGHANWKKMTVN